MALAVAAGSAGASGCSAEARASSRAGAPEADAPREPEPLRVGVAPAQRGPVERPVVVTGVVGGVRELDLGFRVGGVLGAVRVERGQSVRRGQVLAELDATEIAAAVRQADEAARKAQRDKARVDLLFQHGAVAESVRDDATTAERVADAALVSARWTAARAQLVAPEDGVVEARLAEPGEVVAPGRPIVHLSAHPGRAEARAWLVRAPVADAVAVRLSAGDAARVTLPASPGAELDATVVRVAPAASRGTGTYEVELDVRPGAVRLLAGLAARVTFRVAEPRATATVPLAAVVDASGREGAVYVLRDGRAVRVPVTLGAVLPDGRVALEGDVPGEPVVTEGAGLLVPGARARAGVDTSDAVAP